MEINKRLDTDNDAEFLESGTLVHASNIIVNTDNGGIQNEHAIERFIDLEEGEELVGYIACSNEFVLFTNKNRILRHNENTRETKYIESNWKWGGGQVFGDYTYNVNNELIIAISERNSPNKVSFKSINLDSNTYDAMADEDRYTLNPPIPYFNMMNYTRITAANRIYCGTYVFYIRFFINEYDYTPWNLLGSPCIIYNEGGVHEIHNSWYMKDRGDNVILQSQVLFSDYYSNNTEKTNKAIQLFLDIIDPTFNYKFYQIGYIVTTTKNEIIPIVEYKVPIDTKLYTITNQKDNKYTISEDELTNDAFNLYNVKTLTNYNNRIYVANYLEENRNTDIDKIDTSGITVRFVQGTDTVDEDYKWTAMSTRSISEENNEDTDTTIYKATIPNIERSTKANTKYVWNVDRPIANYDFDPDSKYKLKIGAINTSRGINLEAPVKAIGIFNRTDLGNGTIGVDKDYFVIFSLSDYLKAGKDYQEGVTYIKVQDENEYGNYKVISEDYISKYYIAFRKPDFKYCRSSEYSDGELNYCAYLLHIDDIINEPQKAEIVVNTMEWNSDKMGTIRYECYQYASPDAEEPLYQYGRDCGVFAYTYQLVKSSEILIKSTYFQKGEDKKYVVSNNVYNLFIHYVYPNGTYTDGIRINNNMEQRSGSILLGKKSDGTSYYFPYDDNTSLEDVKNAVREQNITTDKHYICKTFLDGVYQDVYLCNVAPELFTDYNNIALYKNSKGESFFRPYGNADASGNFTSGNFEFSNVPMYDEFVGFFFSYEQTEQICAGKAIFSDHTTFQSRNTAVGTLVNYMFAWTQDFQTIGESNFNYIKFGTPIYTSYSYDSLFRIKEMYKTTKVLAGFEGMPYNTYYDKLYAVKNRNIVLPGQDIVGRGALLEIWLNESIALFPRFEGSYTDFNSNAYSCKRVGLLYNYNNNIYMNESKILIPFGYIQYIGNNAGGKKYSFTKKNDSYNINYDYYLYINDFTVSRSTTGDDGNTKWENRKINRYQIYCTTPNGARLVDYSPYPIASAGWHIYPFLPINNWSNNLKYDYHIAAIGFNFASRYPYFAKYLNVEPIRRSFTYNLVDGDGNNRWSENKTNLDIVPDKLDEMFKLPDAYINYSGKLLVNFNKDIYSNFVTDYRKTIRRSDVISDENVENKWKTFRPEEYKIIAENKGDIVNVTGIGSYLIAHCEHSMFIFNRDSSMKTQNKDVQLVIPDAFDIDYVEVFTSDKGYAGIQKHDQFICSNYGYIFYDSDARKLYKYNENELKDITAGIKNLLSKDVTDINFAIDETNVRLIVLGKVNNNGIEQKFAASYSFINNNWISTHTYWYDNMFNTKNNVYFANINSVDKFNFKRFNKYVNLIDNDTNYFNGEFKVNPEDNSIVPYSFIDVLFNNDNIDRVLNYISYIVNKNRNDNYCGDQLVIYTNCCFSDYVDISEPKKDMKDYKHPYNKYGVWFMNWFRNVVKQIDTIPPVDRHTGKYNEIDKQLTKLDNKLIVGKYFVIRFIFRKEDKNINIDDIQCY